MLVIGAAESPVMSVTGADSPGASRVISGSAGVSAGLSRIKSGSGGGLSGTAESAVTSWAAVFVTSEAAAMSASTPGGIIVVESSSTSVWVTVEVGNVSKSKSRSAVDGAPLAVGTAATGAVLPASYSLFAPSSANPMAAALSQFSPVPLV